VKYVNIADKIIDLKNADLTLRDKLIKSGELSAGYSEKMKAMHNHNAQVIDDIIDDIGYPTIDKVGEEASEAAWLIIQHAIGQPDFMRKCAKLLELAVNEDKAKPINLAYLKDRIAIQQGTPQLYGTQFDWDENGEMSPSPVDDVKNVNQRRKSIGLNTLEEQTQMMRRRTKKENEFPPSDYAERKNEIDAWRKSVGWID